MANNKWRSEHRTCGLPDCQKKFYPTAWNQKYCSPKCKEKITQKKFKAENPEYWQRYLERRKVDTKRRPDSLKPPYNPAPCSLCGRPLGKTWNRRFHTQCHRKASNVWSGVEEMSCSTW